PLNGLPPVRNDHNGRSTACNSKTVRLSLAKNLLKQHLAPGRLSLQLFQRELVSTGLTRSSEARFPGVRVIRTAQREIVRQAASAVQLDRSRAATQAECG